jgi:nucleoid-associated protein
MLKRLIAHQILKKKSKSLATLHLRDEVLPASSTLAKLLIEQLRESFQRLNPLAGVFRSEDNAAGSKKTEVLKDQTPAPKDKSAASKEKTDSVFRQDLLAYLALVSDKAFVDFTKAAMKILKDEMANEPLATGGYVVFAEYEVKREVFLMSALLNTMARPSFDKSLNLVPSNPLDFEHLRHGARIRLKGVKANDEGVVQFFSQRADGVSDYFVEFLGCNAVVRPKAQGHLLISALNSIPVSDKTRKKLKEKTYSIWEEARRENRPMTLTEIAAAVSPEKAEKILGQLAAEENDLAGEFLPPPPPVMKQLVRFAFNGDGLRLEFDLNPWVNRVNVDDDKTLTITKVPTELVEALKGV